MAVLEALAEGTPAVISTECYFPEVADAGAGLVLPLNAAAFADGLERTLADPEAARAMGRAGRELVAASYTWPRVAEQVVAVYRDAVAGRKPSST